MKNFPCCLPNAAKNQVCLYVGDMCLEIQVEYEDYKSWKKCVCVREWVKWHVNKDSEL